jgi:hypothetical protein
VSECYTQTTCLHVRWVLSLEDMARIALCALLGTGGMPVPSWEALPKYLWCLAHAMPARHVFYREFTLSCFERQFVWDVDLLPGDASSPLQVSWFVCCSVVCDLILFFFAL